MYAAKAGGGNRITVARGPGSDPLALADQPNASSAARRRRHCRNVVSGSIAC